MAAREDFANKNVRVSYVDVKKDARGLEQMMKYTEGRREVPVIVEGDKVTIGFGGT